MVPVTAPKFHDGHWFSYLSQTLRLTGQCHFVAIFVRSSSQHAFVRLAPLFCNIDKAPLLILYTAHGLLLVDVYEVVEARQQ